MLVYTCPCCANQSVVWDALSRYFLCHNPECARSFPPPKIDHESIARLISQNRVNVTRDWLKRASGEAALIAQVL
jgi:hypothetical protein